jgi:hypothetical protein
LGWDEISWPSLHPQVTRISVLICIWFQTASSADFPITIVLNVVLSSFCSGV